MLAKLRGKRLVVLIVILTALAYVVWMVLSSPISCFAIDMDQNGYMDCLNILGMDVDGRR
jgi:hypothetical protein